MFIKCLLLHNCKQESQTPWPPGASTVSEETIACFPPKAAVFTGNGFILVWAYGSQDLRSSSVVIQARNHQSGEEE